MPWTLIHKGQWVGAVDPATQLGWWIGAMDPNGPACDMWCIGDSTFRNHDVLHCRFTWDVTTPGVFCYCSFKHLGCIALQRFITFIFCAGTFCSCIPCHMIGNIPIHLERHREGIVAAFSPVAWFLFQNEWRNYFHTTGYILTPANLPSGRGSRHPPGYMTDQFQCYIQILYFSYDQGMLLQSVTAHYINVA